MREQDLFIAADQALQHVVDQIKDDQWSMHMPPDFPTMGGGAESLTLREVINYHAYDDAWVPDTLSGRTMDEIGSEAYKGDLLSDDPKTSFATLVDRACAAVQALSDEDLYRTTHLSYGDFPAREYLWHISTYRGLRAHDIAKAIGVSTQLPDNLVQGLWDLLEPNAEEWRQMGVFGPRVDVPADAPLQDRLLGLTGRQPSGGT